MNRRILLLLIFVLPVTLYSQVYRYTKETRVEYSGKELADTAYVIVDQIRIEVQILKNNITITRPPNGAGEPFNLEVYTIKRLTKSGNEAKITTKEGYTFHIYPEGITMRYKSNTKHIDYGFYNGTNKRFRYE